MRPLAILVLVLLAAGPAAAETPAEETHSAAATATAPAATASAAVTATAAATSTTAEPAALGQGRTFFGIPLGTGRKIVFVSDRPLDSLDAVKYEMKRCIGQLTPEDQFHVIFMRSMPVEMPPRRLVEATERNKALAGEFMDGIVCGGESDPEASLKRAFAVQPDTIFLVCDGEPDRSIIDTVKQLEAARRVRVNTIALEYLGGEATLKAVAEAGGGAYQAVPDAMAPYAAEQLRQLFAKPAPYIYTVALAGRKERLNLSFTVPSAPAAKGIAPVDMPDAGPGISQALVEKLGVLGVWRGGPLEVSIVPVAVGHGMPWPLTLYSKDTAGAVFALRHILPPNQQTVWLDRAAKEPEDILAITAEQSFLHKLTEGLDEVPADSADGRAVLAAARAAYDLRRADLVRKFAGADVWLFYPPADKAQWALYRKGAGVIARTWSSDAQFQADFYLDMQKDAAGPERVQTSDRWQCKGIRGGEFFKGE